ncbi:MAG TPA: alpha/beta fold hydrolase [Gemmatimonadales bacterium]
MARRFLPFPAPALVLVAAAAVACAPTETETTREVPTYSVADFYQGSEFFGSGFSSDGTRLLVSSNLSGVFNAYAIPVAGGDPVPLTRSTTDAIFAVSWFPADDRILYSSDQGGNELSHLYVREADSTVRDLTPGEKLQARFAGWSGDDRSFFVTTNERDERVFDLYEYQTDGYARRLVWRNTEAYEVGPISRNKRYVALVRPITTSDQDIYLHDLETGTTTHITQHQGSVANSAADFTPDNAALFFTSDQDREFAALRRYDIATGETTTVLEPAWDVVGAAFTRGGRHLRVWINEEAKVVTRVYEAGAMAEVPMPGLPLGLVRGMNFSRDESAFAFYNTDGSAPDDLWAGKLGATPTRLTNALSPAILRENLVAPTHVRFRSYDSLEVPGLLYKPHQASRNVKAPALVLVHGGPGGQAQVGYFALTQALVNHGYVVFDINNRGSSGYGKTFYKMDDRKHGEADLGDVVASKRMLVETGYVDSARIGIIGGSYGGYMVLAALTLTPDEFTAGVDLFGISNWYRTITSIPPWWESFRKALYEEIGDPATDSARLHRISPLFNATKIRVPLMVLQGANDPRVLQVESDEIVAAARANGVPVEYVVFPDEGHGFVKKENEIKGYTAILTFLDTHLRGGNGSR